MKRKQYKTTVNASRERLWEELWEPVSYEKWTSAFAEGSKVETNWEEGGKIFFLNAENEGMVARIEEKMKPKKMVFKHLGMVDKHGNEDLESEKVKAWSGAEEIYILKENGQKTDLVVKMDLDEGYEDYFDQAWPKAFEKLKELVESQQQENRKISVKTVVKAPVDKVWQYWTEPKHITQWNAASTDWHSPAAENDLRKNGKFSYRMEAKDGSQGFYFDGVYNKIEQHSHISYTLGDGRKVAVDFHEKDDVTVIEETFEAGITNSFEMQQKGWQAILDNFKAYVEQN